MNPVGSMIARLRTRLLNARAQRTVPTKDARQESEKSAATTDPATNALPNPHHDQSDDQLALALTDIANHFGAPVAKQTLTAGLPLVGGRLPLEHVALAAARANLTCETGTTDPLSLSPHELPVIIIPQSGNVEILWQLETGTIEKPAQAIVSLPGTPGDRASKPASDLENNPGLRMVRLRPKDGLDSRASQAIEFGTKNWFLPAFRESRKIYSEAIAATVAINLLGLAVPLFSMNVYDRVLPNAAEATLWALAIGVLIAIVFEFSLRTLRSYFVDAASRRADVRLSNLIFARLMGARLPLQPSSVGVRANTMREFETLREFINSATLTAFGDLPFLALFIGVMWIVAGPLALVVLIAIPIILTIGWLTQRALDKLITQAFREAAQKNAVIVESLSGLESIKAAGAESWAANKWERSTAEHVRLGLKIRHATNLGQHAIHSVQTSVQVFIVVIGFYIVAQGQMTMGALIAATILSGRALQPLAQAANLLARLNQTRIAYTTLSEIVNAPQERPPGETFLAKTECDGKVDFEDVAFTYSPDAQPALTGFSLSIKPGERVAIIGGIGSGKTTALKLLQCLHTPAQGRVLIDGVAASQIEPALLRTHVGLLLQGADLFHGTIRENITISSPSASDDAVIEAAHTAGALEWIAKLPHGFDTAISERGVGLSGGQRQSVALARTLLAKPRIIALDEPTSDMDGRTEQNVITRLRKWSTTRTLITVTHRPALLELVNRIIVVEGGRKIEDGPKAKVLAALKARTLAQTAKTKTRTAPSVARATKTTVKTHSNATDTIVQGKAKKGGAI